MSTEREQVAYELAREFPGPWQSLPGCIKDELVAARLKLAAADRLEKVGEHAEQLYSELAEREGSQADRDAAAALRSALLEYSRTKV